MSPVENAAWRTAKEFVTSRYWEPEKKELLHEDLTIDFPSAAPGIPQHMDAFGVFVWMDFLRNTVKTWDVTLQEFHNTPGTGIFWAVGLIHAEVFWGGQDGVLDTKFIMRVDVQDDKVIYVKQMMGALDFLKAAGREVPLFRMDLNHPEIDEFLKNEPAPAPADEALDMSPEAIEQRRINNLIAFTTGDYYADVPRYLTMSPNVSNSVFFLPPEMRDSYSPEELVRVEAWTHLSCPKLTFFHKGDWFPTEDPHLFFAEYACYGKSRWLGNNTEGHYQNAYYYLIRIDDAGRMEYWEEYLNTNNKFNSINVSLPTFPYYFF